MARRHHTGILREGMCVASRCPPLGLLPIPFLLSLFLRSPSPYADSRSNLHATSRSSHSRRSLSCPVVLFLNRSPLPRSVTTPPPEHPGSQFWQVNTGLFDDEIRI